MKPAVSILMAVYNGERFLREAMDSVLKQTFGDFEFLICDDGSTDESGRILAEYAAADPRVRVITQANQGLTKSLNMLLQSARGELVARFDGDDVCEPERLREQFAAITGDDRVVLVGSAVRLIDEHGFVIGEPDVVCDNATIQPELLRGNNCIVHPTAVFRRRLAIECGGYDESYRYAQDLELWLRLGERGHLVNIPERLVRYRQHLGSVSGSNAEEQLKLMERACITAANRRCTEVTFERRGHWLPVGGDAELFKEIIRRGWYGFGRADRKMVRHYSLKAIGARPLSVEAWRLALCGALKL